MLDFLGKTRQEGSLDELRDGSGGIKVVFICGDTPLPYINDYFAALGDNTFPKVKEE